MKTERFWEIDVVRAVGLLLMLVQHSVIVWNYVTKGLPAAPEAIDTIGLVGGWIFVLLVGVSSYLSYYRMIQRASIETVFHRFLWRGVQLLGWALLVTAASIMVVPRTPILFGVLHFIGIAVIISPFLVRYQWLRWGVIGVVPLTALLINKSTVTNLWLLPPGLYPTSFASLDYWPLLPWLAVPAVGIELGFMLYPKGERSFSVSQLKSQILVPIAWIGRHTLPLYLVHIPLLYVLLTALHYLVN